MTHQAAAMEREHIERYLAFQKIVEEIVGVKNPYYVAHMGAEFCRFCDSVDHYEDCIWVRSRELVEKE